MQSSGCLQCFCYQQFEIFGLQQTINQTYGQDNVKMCGEYFEILIKATSFQQGLTYALSLFNQILRYLVIYAVTWIGYATETTQLSRVTIVTFLCQFFNTAFLLLLVNADLSE